MLLELDGEVAEVVRKLKAKELGLKIRRIVSPSSVLGFHIQIPDFKF